MANTTHVVYIDAPPSRVYKALASTEQLSRWWCQCTGDSHEGGEMTFVPGTDSHIKVFVEKSVDNRVICWRCEQTFLNAKGKHCAATIEFVLWPKQSGTQVVFNRFDVSHDLEEDSPVWFHNLQRLKSLIERGFADYTASHKHSVYKANQL
jgi:uncharacterized protein YndB with AHSA1/START domain